MGPLVVFVGVLVVVGEHIPYEHEHDHDHELTEEVGLEPTIA